MSRWERIVVHCSDSSWGSASEIRKWHVEGNGWDDIGYQYVINNGFVKSGYFLSSMDGSVEVGRTMDGDMIAESSEKGAHAYGYNSNSIGICLIGVDKFTASQMGALFSLIADLSKRFEISKENIVGHYELDPRKTCPNINMTALRQLLN